MIWQSPTSYASQKTTSAIQPPQPFTRTTASETAEAWLVPPLLADAEESDTALAMALLVSVAMDCAAAFTALLPPQHDAWATAEAMAVATASAMAVAVMGKAWWVWSEWLG